MLIILARDQRQTERERGENHCSRDFLLNTIHICAHRFCLIMFGCAHSASTEAGYTRICVPIRRIIILFIIYVSMRCTYPIWTGHKWGLVLSGGKGAMKKKATAQHSTTQHGIAIIFFIWTISFRSHFSLLLHLNIPNESRIYKYLVLIYTQSFHLSSLSYHF